MKKFLNLTGTNPQKSDDPVINNSLCLKSVCNILQHFKISSRLKYFPEYQKEKKYDTIIVAYAINNYLIYSNKDLQLIVNEGHQKLQLTELGNPIVIDRIKSFQLFLPYFERKEIHFSKSTYLPNGTAEAQEVKEVTAKDFIRGNSITLFIRNTEIKGIPHLDTTVEKKVILKDDIYANRPLVLLTPLLDSFECIDFRRFNRLNTNIPCLFSLGKNKSEHQCTIQDFSERFIRIEFLEDNEKTIRGLTPETKIYLKILSEQDDENIICRGKIFRIRKCFIVVSLHNIMKGGKYQNIDELDEIYIKSTLLGHSSTQR